MPLGLPGELLGSPAPGEPLGRGDHDPVSAPIAAKVGLDLSGRIAAREMTATQRWELNETEEEDEVDETPDLTPRHRRPF